LLAIQEKKDVAYRPLHFTWNKIKNEYDISLDPYDGTTYEAYFDGNESGGALTFHLFTRVFLFASPRTTNYNEFVKQRCYKVYLNPWSKGECEKFAEIIQFKDKNEWQRRFDLVGGKPRFLFSLSTQFNDLVTDVNRGIPQSLDQLKDQVQLFEQKVFDDRMQHIAFSIYRDEDEPSLSYLTYSSSFVKGMMNARFNIGSAIEIRTLLHTPEPNLKSWRGKVIEKFLLEDLATATFRVKLIEEHDPDCGCIEKLGPFNADSRRFSSASIIGNELMLNIPVSKTFPAIDGVLVVPDEHLVIYAHSTVSHEHPIKLKLLKDIYNTLRQQSEFGGYSHMFLFIVPGDIYDSFTVQHYKNSNGKDGEAKLGIDVKQYVGTVDSNIRFPPFLSFHPSRTS